MSRPFDIDKLPGLKAREMRPCLLCRKPLTDGGAITFYRVTLERYIFDVRAVRRGCGLAEHFGGGGAGFALAEIMGTDDDWAKRVGDADAALICDACAIRSAHTPIAGLHERMVAERPAVDEGETA